MKRNDTNKIKELKARFAILTVVVMGIILVCIGLLLLKSIVSDVKEIFNTVPKASYVSQLIKNMSL